MAFLVKNYFAQNILYKSFKYKSLANHQKQILSKSCKKIKTKECFCCNCKQVTLIDWVYKKKIKTIILKCF